MADFSVSLTKGQAATTILHSGSTPDAGISEGTASPTAASTIELRIDQTTTVMTRRDILLALDKFKLYFQSLGETGVAAGGQGIPLQP